MIRKQIDGVEFLRYHNQLITLAAATYNGKLFVVGGYIIVEGQRTPTNKSFIYDPSVDKWKEIKSMPTSRGALTANFINDILYVIGGQDSSRKTMGNNEAYDLKTDIWTEKQPMPTKRHHLASAGLDGKLYVVGGRQTDNSPDLTMVPMRHMIPDWINGLHSSLCQRKGVD